MPEYAYEEVLREAMSYDAQWLQDLLAFEEANDQDSSGALSPL